MFINEISFSGVAYGDAQLNEYNSRKVANAFLINETTFKDKATKADKTTKISLAVSAWGDAAYTLSQARKGDNVFVKGKLINKKSEKNGATTYSCEISATHVMISKETAPKVASIAGDFTFSTQASKPVHIDDIPF